MPDHGLLARHRASGGAHAAERRVAGIHRAEGLAGTPRRYVVIVAFLVAMASLPTLAAISAGSATLADDDAGRTTPFIAQQAEVPVVIVPVTQLPIGPQPTLVPVADALDRASEQVRRRPAQGPTKAPSRPASGAVARPAPVPETAPARPTPERPPAPLPPVPLPPAPVPSASWPPAQRPEPPRRPAPPSERPDGPGKRHADDECQARHHRPPATVSRGGRRCGWSPARR